MNKQTASKFEFFMGGVKTRFFEENMTLTATFTSGLKKYAFEAKPDENGAMSFNFGGTMHKFDYDGAIAFISQEIPNYDALLVNLRSETDGIIIEALNKDVTLKNEKIESKADNYDGSMGDMLSHVRASSMSNRKYYIKPEKAGKLLEAIGLLGANGKVRNDKIRKYNQIDHFIELIDPLLRDLCKSKEGLKDKTINVCDCACGKSYLSFAIYYYVREVLGYPCHITGLDYNHIVIEDSNKIAAKLGYKDVTFVETDIMKYEADRKYDLLITLHACDTATDKSLSFAMNSGIRSIVCVPCCHREMNDQGYSIPGLELLLNYGILRARMADSLTDAMRALYLEAMGYDVSIVEYISPLDTPKNLMMRCTKTHGVNVAKLAQFEELEKTLGVHLSINK